MKNFVVVVDCLLSFRSLLWKLHLFLTSTRIGTFHWEVPLYYKKWLWSTKRRSLKFRSSRKLYNNIYQVNFITFECQLIIRIFEKRRETRIREHEYQISLIILEFVWRTNKDLEVVFIRMFCCRLHRDWTDDSMKYIVQKLHPTVTKEILLLIEQKRLKLLILMGTFILQLNTHTFQHAWKFNFINFLFLFKGLPLSTTTNNNNNN
jgi:hypothetical protein